MTRGEQLELSGSPQAIARLLAAESRLGVRFCEDYRKFIADPDCPLPCTRRAEVS